MKNKVFLSLLLGTLALGIGTLSGIGQDSGKSVRADTTAGTASVTKIETWNTNNTGDEFISLYLSGTDYSSDTSNSAYYNFSVGTFPEQNYLEYIELDGTPISTLMSANGVTPYSIAAETKLNFFVRPLTFTFYGQGVGHAYSKITIKAGCKFPSWDYKVNGGAESYYVTASDITFERTSDNHTQTVCDTWAVYIAPYDYSGTSITTDIDIVQLRTPVEDRKNYFLKIKTTVNDYSSATNNQPLSAATYLDNLNLLDKAHVDCWDGRSYTLREIVGNSFYLYKWGEPCFWISVSTDFVNSVASLKYVHEIVFEKGCEFPSYAGTDKYVLEKETCLAWANTTLYDDDGNASGSVNAGYETDVRSASEVDKSFAHRSYRNHLGNVTASVTRDVGADCTNILWVKVDGAGYTADLGANIVVSNTCYFALNTLSRISINGTSIAASHKIYGSSCFINRFERYSYLGIEFNEDPVFDYTKITSVTIEAGCEFPAADCGNGFMQNANIGYYTTTETVTYEFVEDDFYTPISVSFDGVSVAAYNGRTIPSANIPADPTMESTATVAYVFSGWYDSVTGQKFNPATDFPYDGMKLVSRFSETVREYKVTYYNEDGTVYQETSVPNGATLTLIDVPAKAGYTGVWAGTAYEVMPTEDISYTVSYTANAYTLSFEGTDETINVTYDAAIGTLPEGPAKTGYAFTGWSIDGNVITSETVWNYTENKTAVALYEANSYVLSFEGTDETVNVTYDSAIGTLPEVPSRPGYDGVWTIDGSVITSETVWNYTENKTAVVTYSVHDYVLSFEGITNTITVHYGEAIGNLPEIPVKVGYTSISWTIDGATVSAETVWNYTENKTAVASYQIMTFTVTFEGAEGVTSQTVNYGDKVTRPEDPVLKGYVFEGWYVGETEYDFDTPVTSDLTLTAKWAKKSGCSGSVAATSGILAVLSLTGIGAFFFGKKEK